MAAVALLPAGLLAAGSVAAASAPAASAPAAGTLRGGPARCTSVIQIVRPLAFSPPAWVSGDPEPVASLVARNCTRQAQQAEIWWLAAYTGTSSAALCPGLDPFPEVVTFAPRQVLTLSNGYGVPACITTGIELTVDIDQAGTSIILAGQDADLAISEPVSSFSPTPAPAP